VTREMWRPVPDWPGYSISNLGRVRSEERQMIRTNGRRYTVPGRILAVYAYNGRPSVNVNHLGERSRLSAQRLMREVWPTVTGWELADRIDLTERQSA
jgi:hypothetical protein